MAPIKLSWPDWQYPEWLDQQVRSSQWWVEHKKKDDGAEGLWRIYDGIYDLTKWADSHPGGKSWINMTRGLDVTEVFESFHINPMVEKKLPEFFVRSANTPRNSPYTFHPNGFFKTFKKRAYDKLKDHKKGPTLRTLVFVDIMVVITFLLSILAAKYYNYYIGMLAGICMTCTIILAHNFFHKRDSWRMYYFQLSLLSVRQWRISHALSHHIFTNTRLDLEILLFEPILQWFPKEHKSWIVKYASLMYSPLLYSLLFIMQTISRLIIDGVEQEDSLILVLPITMYFFSGANLIPCLGMWIWVIMCTSFTFFVIGLNAAHHHPDIFHEGDTARKDKDWGLNQIDAVSDRVEVVATFPWAHLSFGDHTLHHLLPTIDHDYLPELYPILEKTCSEFGVDFRFKTTWDLLKGQFRQLGRTTVNTTPREDIKHPIKKLFMVTS